MTIGKEKKEAQVNPIRKAFSKHLSPGNWYSLLLGKYRRQIKLYLRLILDKVKDIKSDTSDLSQKNF